MASTPTRPRPAARRRAAPRPELDLQRFVFEDASWDLYERLLREVGNGPTRLTYDQGRLDIMSPLPGHGEISRVLCLFVFDLALASGRPIRMLGSTTLRRRLRRRGLEPDECFYIANEPRVRGKQRLSIPRDPPPDLAVEIDVTNSSIDRMPIYAALQVPQVWRYSRQRLRRLHLRARDVRGPAAEPVVPGPPAERTDAVPPAGRAGRPSDGDARVPAVAVGTARALTHARSLPANSAAGRLQAVTPGD